VKPIFYLFFLLLGTRPVHGMNTPNLTRSEHKRLRTKIQDIYSSWIRDNMPPCMPDGYASDSDIVETVDSTSSLKRKPSQLDCTERKYIAQYWNDHPYKPHYKSAFHHYTESNRRKSLPPSFKIKPIAQNSKE
jgi:hypothetical protein